MPQVDLEVKDGIATVTFRRPEQLNALSLSVLEELDQVVGRLEQDDAILGVIITGEGRAFVAGADITELAKLERRRGHEFVRYGQGILSRIERLPKPVVAAINGFALGGGCEIALACHIRLASSKARFGQPEVKLGLIPGFGGTQRLPRVIGRGIATQMLIAGGPISAERALAVGLANEVVEPEGLLDRAREILTEILANGPQAVASTLKAVHDGLERTLEEGLALEADLFANLCGTDEMHEGTRAFLEKRDPKFR
jgi:enoyl-CoA hydratase